MTNKDKDKIMTIGALTMLMGIAVSLAQKELRITTTAKVLAGLGASIMFVNVFFIKVSEDKK